MAKKANETKTEAKAPEAEAAKPTMPQDATDEPPQASPDPDALAATEAPPVSATAATEPPMPDTSTPSPGAAPEPPPEAKEPTHDELAIMRRQREEFVEDVEDMLARVRRGPPPDLAADGVLDGVEIASGMLAVFTTRAMDLTDSDLRQRAQTALAAIAIELDIVRRTAKGQKAATTAQWFEVVEKVQIRVEGSFDEDASVEVVRASARVSDGLTSRSGSFEAARRNVVEVPPTRYRGSKVAHQQRSELRAQMLAVVIR